MPDWVQYLLVFGALVAAAFGAPIPEEAPIIAAGIMVGHATSDPDSWLYWWAMLPVCIAGVVVCDGILYWIGRRWGPRLLAKPWVQRHVLPPEKRRKIEENFHEYGIGILLFARLLPGIRTPVFLMAGVMHLPFRRFLLADGLYALPGVNLLFWLSYVFTEQFKLAFEKVEHNRSVVIAVILAAVSGFLLFAYLKRRVTTGSPEEVPVFGKPLAHLAHSHHGAPPEPKPGEAAEPPPERPAEPLNGEAAPPGHGGHSASGERGA